MLDKPRIWFRAYYQTLRKIVDFIGSFPCFGIFYNLGCNLLVFSRLALRFAVDIKLLSDTHRQTYNKELLKTF